jgi:hypothetical protein
MHDLEKSIETKIQYICDAKEVFTPDPDDPGKTILTIPPNVLAKSDFKVGDDIKVSIGDQGTIILEKV